jgi:tRNA-modifying protein YgfZ
MVETDVITSLHKSAVVLGDKGHDVLCGTGNDRILFLHRITSGKVAGLEAGQGGRTLLLDVKGRVLASLLVFARKGSVRLIVPAGQGDDVVAGLAKYAIMDDFQIAREVELASLAVLGPEAALALGNATGLVLPDLLGAPLFAHTEVQSDRFGALWLAHGRACGADGICVVTTQASRDALRAVLLAQGTPTLSDEVAEAARILALEPKPGCEILPDRFPVEIGLGKAIDHTKGCYVGQETIVRMRDRGNVRRRLVLLRLSDGVLPSAADKISTDEVAAAGHVTSAAAMSGESPVALATLAVSVAVGAKVRIQHGDAQLVAEVSAETPAWG